MKTQLWVYIVIGVLSVGVGLAIAGVPNSVARDATIQAPSTTDAPVPTVPESAPIIPITDPQESDTTLTTSPPDTTTTAPPTASTTTLAPPLPDRADVALAVVNGAEISGVAGRAAAALEQLGYVDVGSLDGTDVVEVSAVFAGDGSEAVAEQIADELDLEPGLVLPLDEMPQIDGSSDATVVVYLGRDASGLPFFG